MTGPPSGGSDASGRWEAHRTRGSVPVLRMLAGARAAATVGPGADRGLGEDTIFTYVLPEGPSRRGASGDGSYLPYAGAFEERRASAWLEATLREEGHRPQLMTGRRPQLMIPRGEPR